MLGGGIKIRQDNSREDLFKILGNDFAPDMDQIMASDSPKARFKIDLMRAVLKRFQDVLSKRHIDFLVVIIPCMTAVADQPLRHTLGIPYERYYVAEDMTRKLCEEAGVPSLDLSPLFLKDENSKSYYDIPDGHFSVAGCEHVAGIIAEALRRTGVENPAPLQ